MHTLQMHTLGSSPACRASHPQCKLVARPMQTGTPIPLQRGRPCSCSAGPSTSSPDLPNATVGDLPAPAGRPRLTGFPDCTACGATGRSTCQDCGGTGRLKRGGYNKNNTVDMSRILSSKWTAMQETMGWRHFQVIEQRKEGRLAFLLMQASCDTSVRLWVNSKNLKERALWAAGWLQMADIRAAGGGNNGGEETTDSSNDSANSSSGGGGGGSSGSGSAAARPVCRGCTGTGWRSCVACNGSGRSSLIEL